MTRPLALEGVRVVDFSWVVAGPMATRMLAAMGAEVIKIESTTRPEFQNRKGFFAVMNIGKKSITVNIASDEGQELIRRLTARSDIVVENFSARVLRKYHMTYDDLCKVRPDLIFCSASGVGRSGPLSDTLAYGTLLQGYSGRAGLVGKVNLDLEAMGIVPSWTDPVTAMWEIVSILAALRHRSKTGQGSYIDLSMLEGTVALLPEALLRAGLDEPAEVTGGNRDPQSSPAGAFKCAGNDQWLALSIGTDAEWRALCAAIGRADLAVAYPTHAKRLAGKDALNAAVAAWTAQRDAREAETLLQSAGVPASRSRSMKDLLDDPQLAARGVFPMGPDGKRIIALPWVDDEGWRGRHGREPVLGGDNDYVFGELLGLKHEEIQRLMKEDVIS